MDLEPVSSSESPVKNVVATTASTVVAATPEQLAQKVVELFQEWTVCGRATSAVIIRFCSGFDIFTKDANRAKNDDAMRS